MTAPLHVLKFVIPINLQERPGLTGILLIGESGLTVNHDVL